jgi:hypothetical protein
MACVASWGCLLWHENAYRLSFTLWTILPLLCCPLVFAAKEASEMACRIVLHALVDDKQLLVLLPLTLNLLLTVLLLALAAARNRNYKCRQMLRRTESLNKPTPRGR